MFEYRGVLLLMRVQPNQQTMASCDSVFTGSKDNVCIQSITLELSVNDKTCEPFPICRIVMYIDIDDASNYNRFSVSLFFHSDGILHCHAKQLSLHPPITYSQTFDHSVTVGFTKTVLLIRPHLVVTRCRALIHSWKSWRHHNWSRCGPHCLHICSKWGIWFKNYCASGMTCDEIL